MAAAVSQYFWEWLAPGSANEKEIALFFLYRVYREYAPREVITKEKHDRIGSCFVILSYNGNVLEYLEHPKLEKYAQSWDYQP